MRLTGIMLLFASEPSRAHTHHVHSRPTREHPRAFSRTLSLSLSLSHTNASRPSFILAPKSAARESIETTIGRRREAQMPPTRKQLVGKGVLLRFTNEEYGVNKTH